MSTERRSVRHIALRLPLTLCVLAVVVLVFGAGDSLACTCIPWQRAAQELERATAVFSGKILIAQSASDGAGSDTRSEQFTKDVQDLARQFAQRLKETREFRPEGDKLFVDGFVDCHL